MTTERVAAIRSGTALTFDQRQARYIRLRDRVAEGATLEAAGAAESPALSKARVSAILAKPPAPPGRPTEYDARENLRSRLRYWQRKRAQPTGLSAVQLREIDDQIAGLTAELAETDVKA